MSPCREITASLAKRPDLAILPQECASSFFGANRVFEIYKTDDVAAWGAPNPRQI
jgi:hypothetical protein